MADYVWYLSGLPFWYGNLQVLAGNAMARRDDPYVPLARRSAVVREARSMLVAYAILLPSLALADLLVSTLLLPLLLASHFFAPISLPNMRAARRRAATCWPTRARF